MAFPHVDPIPLPAPVWLMKGLGLLTLALHFAALQMLIGSLIMVIWFNLSGRAKKDSARLSASHTLARRLPVMMTFVINLGVPPLLFLQVLYGRAIYSSSVLIGVSWFAVIPMLIAAYWLLYRVVDWIAKDKPAWVPAVISFLIIAGIGQIYAMNMSLMLRPEVWAQMYANSPFGAQAPPKDPTSTPRWLFVMTGGLAFGGLWMVLLSNMKHISGEVQSLLRRSGGRLAVLGGVVQAAMAVQVFRTQPETVQQGLNGNTLYQLCGVVFLVMAALMVLLGALQSAMKSSHLPLSIAGILAGVLAQGGAVIYRDGIRDLTLSSKGFDVWDRVVVTNWSVVILFLLLLVLGIATVIWLLLVMRRAKPIDESVVTA